MDSGVSWRSTISTARLQYPNADQFTTIYLAKQLYLANFGAYSLGRQKRIVKQSSGKAAGGKLRLQGAGA